MFTNAGGTLICVQWVWYNATMLRRYNATMLQCYNATIWCFCSHICNVFDSTFSTYSTFIKYVYVVLKVFLPYWTYQRILCVSLNLISRQFMWILFNVSLFVHKVNFRLWVLLPVRIDIRKILEWMVPLRLPKRWKSRSQPWKQ